MQIVLEQLEVKFLFSGSAVQASSLNDGLGMMSMFKSPIQLFATLNQFTNCQSLLMPHSDWEPKHELAPWK